VIIPDGRTDYEKLRELLGNPEETHLDLKASVDLGEAIDRLKFVKDVVKMSNRPPDGYILIGVDDAGAPGMPIGSILDRSRFDGARLGGLVRGYIEGEIHLRVQIHVGQAPHSISEENPTCRQQPHRKMDQFPSAATAPKSHRALAAPRRPNPCRRERCGAGTTPTPR
jgi:hypothetical protein